MKTEWWAVAMVLAATFLTSSAQIFYKLATRSISLDIAGLLTNYYLIEIGRAHV